MIPDGQPPALVTERGLSLVMISHDLSVLAETCSRVLVMRRGQIVEDGPVEQVLLDPQHEYTRTLLAAAPRGLGER
ncbi:hypothetical protein HJ590_01875 [Naumannella sp. ID2617S]|nr:hypothetical protein [Naumannella sp. ID2617S]